MSRRRERGTARRDPVRRAGPASGVLAAPAAPVPSAAVTRGALVAAWLVVAAFAIAVLAIARGPHRIGAFDVESDFYGGYAPAAQLIQHGHLVAADGKLPAVYGFVGPLYPALLALAGGATGDLFDAAELLSWAAAVAVLGLWWLLLRRRSSATHALVVVLLLATNPVLVRYGYSATTDTTALAFQSAALCVLFTSRSTTGAAAAGLLAGLAVLTRYPGVYLLPAGLLAIAAGATTQARRLRAVLAWLGGALSLILPWQLFAHAHGGEVHFQQLLAFDVYGKARGMSWDAFLAGVWPRYEHSPLAVFTAEPGAVARRMVFNLGDHLRLDSKLLLGGPVAAAAALFPVLTVLDRRLLRTASLALPGTWGYLALVPAAHDERYSLMVLPFYLLLAGATLALGFSSAVRGWLPALLRSAVVGGVVALSLRATTQLQVHVLEQQPLETLACAGRLRQLARPGDRVIARKPNLAFHAGVGAVYFPPFDSLGGLARFARENSARWLYVSPSEAQLRPMAAFLLDTSATVPGLTLRAYSSVPTQVDGLAWQRVAALYEIGPAFGRSPAWLASNDLRTLHILRGMAATLPDARVLLRLAGAEVGQENLAGAQAAWRSAARIDPKGVTEFLRRFHGDTLMAVARGQALFH